MSESSRLIAEKQQRLYQQQFEQQHKQLSVKQLIEFILRINLDNDSLYPALRDGRILCRIMNTFHQPADYIHFSDFEPLPKFKQIENIQLFLKKCSFVSFIHSFAYCYLYRLYVPEDQLFHPNDLLESADLQQVLNCLLALFDYFQDYIKNDLYNMNYYNGVGGGANLNRSTTGTDYYYNANGGISYFYPYYQVDNDNNNNSNNNNHSQQQQDMYDQSSSNNNNNNSEDQCIIPKKGLNGYILDCIIGTRKYILAPFFICVALGFGIKMSRTTFIKLSNFIAKHPPSTIKTNIITPTLNIFSIANIKQFLFDLNTQLRDFINDSILPSIPRIKIN
ncbi:hypothetical protein PPL_06099 [Heterostelium album PN500]|uniref:Calponin-homology (CH) domain-containing protein n=1 Tax=Heterostelium pallidum (strain ATCC 26659 / Pp 5 / PN500) TaxID=670386 RepID=D3BC77_HETP5|nr:hypothetical protein PPL_06099 [Heterostelium album PN500]EFA81260.1 hypothetical protein PPL_06099 [Heterostelium album PN500]|eukprot:XP_020433378.1 hypothetical protein PPL_06099 [Heterostelium album PN500]